VRIESVVPARPEGPSGRSARLARRRRRGLRSRRAGAAGARAGQAGYSLVELVVVAALLLTVLGAFLTTLETAQRVVPNDVQWSLAIQQGSTGLQRMERELRRAVGFYATTPNSVDFRVSSGTQDTQVLYSCDVAQPGTAYRQCVRLQAPVGQPLGGVADGEPVVVRLLNGTVSDPVFTFTPNGLTPTFATITLKLAARGEQPGSLGYSHAIVLSDGAYLRNQGLGAQS